MSATAQAKVASARQDATRWRRFLTNSPPLRDLIEIRRLNDHKSVLRRRGELPSAIPARGLDARLL